MVTGLCNLDFAKFKVRLQNIPTLTRHLSAFFHMCSGEKMNFDPWREKDRSILGKLRISFQIWLVLALLLSGIGTSFAVMPSKDKQLRSFNEAKSDQEAVYGKNTGKANCWSSFARMCQTAKK